MRPINSVPPTPTNGVQFWNTPIPYLFGGLALMLVLISVALVILVCSYRKRPSDSSSDSAEDMKQQVMAKDAEFNSEPEVLVIMAGDDKPTYLAKPITPSNYCTCGEAEPTTTTTTTSASSSTTTEQRVLTN